MRCSKETKKELKIWADKVKSYWQGCAICGETKRLNAHHLIPKEIKEHRFDIENGIALCPKHHRFSFKLSAHQNPIAFVMWLEENLPEKLKIIKSKINKIGFI